jgi:hypothetical protein
MLNLLTQKELMEKFSLYADPFLIKHKEIYKRCPTPNCDNVLAKKMPAPRILDHIRKIRGTKDEAQLNSDDEQLMVEAGNIGPKQPVMTDDKALEEEHFEDSSFEALVEENDSPDGNKTAVKRQFVFCECCGHDFCFECMKNHYGEDCKKDALAAGMLEAGLLGLQNCPSCENPYERDYGCHHMTCGYCRAHFCNICFEVFPEGDGRAPYDHLLKKHGKIEIDQRIEAPPQQVIHQAQQNDLQAHVGDIF